MGSMGIRRCSTHNLEYADEGVPGGSAMSDHWDEVTSSRRRRHRRGGRRARSRAPKTRQTEEQRLYRQASRRAAIKLSVVSHAVTYGAVVVMLLFVAGFRAGNQRVQQRALKVKVVADEHRRVEKNDNRMSEIALFAAHNATAY